MSEKTLESLHEAIQTSRAKLRLQVEALCEVITEDLPGYVLKKVRAAFVNDVDFAEAKTDVELVALKQNIADFGVALSERVQSHLLSDMEDWWGPDISLEAAGKTLNGNHMVWRKLEAIGTDIEKFIVDAGLEPMSVQYKTPAYFIDGKYLPGLIEKYWAQLAALRAVEEELALTEQEARKTRQASRWDTV